MSKSNRLQFISVMQIIGMLLIVFSHSISKYAEYPQGTGLFIQIIQYAGLTAFMWCSGYLLVYTKALERHGYKEYIIRRLQRLMIPYFVIQIVMLFPKLAIVQMQGMELNVNYFHSFFYPREGILPHLWFLPTLMILCLMTPILLKWTEKKKLCWIPFVLLMILAILPDVKNILCMDDVRRYLFWYTLGIIMARWYSSDKLMNFLASSKVVLTIPIYILSFIFISYAPLKWIVCSLCTLTLLLSVGICCSRNDIGGGYLSRYTFTIYILSLPAQNVIEVLAGKLGFDFIVSTIVMFSIGIIVPLLIAIIVEMIENKTHVKIFSKCIGL